MELTSKPSKKKRKTDENILKSQKSIVNNESIRSIQPLCEIQPLNILPSQQYRCPSPPFNKYQLFSETDFLSNELNFGKCL